jgi:hypothetical protein
MRAYGAGGWCVLGACVWRVVQGVSSRSEGDQVSNVEILTGKWNLMPGGEVIEASSSEVVIFVCRMTKSYIHMPAKEGVDEGGTLAMERDECLLRLPAEASDIPAVVALVASRASKRRRR